jgi:hypothetical protein
MELKNFNCIALVTVCSSAAHISTEDVAQAKPFNSRNKLEVYLRNESSWVEKMQ